MAIFNSTSWTGGQSVAEVAGVVSEKPRMESAPKKLKPRVDTNLLADAALAEYREVAKEIGISHQDLIVEEFRIFLARHDLPTFHHQEVVAYMDEIAAKDNPTGYGWHWCPVRQKDAEVPMAFGRPSGRDQRTDKRTSASDFYESHEFERWHVQGNSGWSSEGVVVYGSSSSKPTVNVESHLRVMQAAHDEMFKRPPIPRDWRNEPCPAYARTLPLHALKKIALVEREFKSGRVVFLVTDYTTAPHVIVNPDPFLMAVIPNSAIGHGKGRFIIDVWDEPGFGLDKMLK